MLVHHPLARVGREVVPGPRLHEGVDEEVLALARQQLEPVAEPSMRLTYMRALLQRQVAVRLRQVGAERRAVELRLHVLEARDVLRNAPEHEVDVRAQADEGVGAQDEVVARPTPHQRLEPGRALALVAGRRRKAGSSL